MKNYIAYIAFFLLCPFAQGMSKEKDKKQDQYTFDNIVSRTPSELYYLIKAPQADAFDINKQYPEKQNATLFIHLCSQIPENMSVRWYKAILKKMLDDRIVDPKLRDDNGWTALHAAAVNPELQAIKVLLQNMTVRTLINRRTKNRCTALNLAVAENRIDHVKLLLRVGDSNPNISSVNPLTYPLHHTIRGKSFLKKGIQAGIEELIIMRDLVEAGADTTCMTEDNKPLMFIALQKYIEGAITADRVYALLAVGVPVDNAATIDAFLEAAPLLSADGERENTIFLRSCIRAAVLGGKIHKSLLTTHDEHFDDTINAQDPILGMTSLMWAAARGNVPLARQLLAAGADIEAIDSFGDAPLHHAVRNRQTALVACITDHLAKVHSRALIMKNNNDRMPVDVALAAKPLPRDILALLAK